MKVDNVDTREALYRRSSRVAVDGLAFAAGPRRPPLLTRRGDVCPCSGVLGAHYRCIECKVDGGAKG